MYNPGHAVYARTVSGRYSSTKPKSNQRLPKLRPRPQTADSGGTFFYTRADTATAATKCQLATSAPTRRSSDSRVCQLFRSLCYDNVLQLRTYGTVQRAHLRPRSNSRSATTGDSARLIWEHRHKYRRRIKGRKRQWLMRAGLCALSTEYGSH